MENFYVTCSSNLQTEIYNDNKPHHFITPLIKPLKLTPTKWEVAITELSYPTSYYNVNENETQIIWIRRGNLSTYVKRNIMARMTEARNLEFIFYSLPG